MAKTTTKPIIAFSAPVTIAAAEGEGENKKPPKFNATFYTGGELEIEGWEHPVVVDLEGLSEGNVLVANLDHDRTKRVGNFKVTNDGKTLVANGVASARTPAREEVIGSAEDGYEWQASLEVRPKDVELVKAGKTATANGQEFEGPVYVTRKGILKGFAFVSHGADDNTSASIAAAAAHSQEPTKMRKEVQKWIKELVSTIDIEAMDDDEVARIEAQYDGINPPKKNGRKLQAAIDDKAAEIARTDEITQIALAACDGRTPDEIDHIRRIAAQAVEEKWATDKLELALYRASIPSGVTIYSPSGPDSNRITGKMLEAACCMNGRLSNIEKHFDERTLQMAEDRFKNGIGLKQLIIMGAQANGYAGHLGYDVTLEIQRAAFGMLGPIQRAAPGFSTIHLPNVFSNIANKFLREGWMAVDQTPLRIANIRSVRDFKQITTVSLTGGLMFEEVAADGQLKHGQVGEEVYNNQAKTRGIMFAITRVDMINDDLGALTAVPRRIGRGGMLTLNDVFWTEFLNPSVANFWHTNNANVNTGVADMTIGGLTATEVVFMDQTDPDGNPLLSQPRILLVPTALKAAALTLMASERLIDGTATAKQGDKNIYQGRFTVESSPYMSNSAYTGYSAAAWYMLGDPGDLPVIEIAALNGKVEPVVETADADFNVLGIQMRGYSDIGVKSQEPRGGVRADGGSS